MSLVVALYAIKVRPSFRLGRNPDIDTYRQLTSRRITDTDTKYSYGWHRAEILAALINGVFLLALCFSIFMEAIQRFVEKQGIPPTFVRSLTRI